MRVKAIQDLELLDDGALFRELSAGLSHISANADAIYRGAEILGEKGNSRGSEILSVLSEEEASKFLILIDAARCPRDRLRAHLRRYYDHLAKGLYAAACYWAPETLGDLVSYVDSERQRYYLDGPNEVDWIFWNQILFNREQTIYVDYSETDQGHAWLAPSDAGLSPFPSMALGLVQAMNRAGFGTPRGLQIISLKWRGLHLDPHDHFQDLRERNWDTLKACDHEGLVSEIEDKHVRAILDHWPFPLHSVDLSLSGVDNRPDLRNVQKAWHPS